ncbi:endonuclease V [Zhurongbacter thermophilus]
MSLPISDLLYPKNLKQAREVQRYIRERLILDDEPPLKDRFVFGVVDVSANMYSPYAYAACTVFEYPSLKMLDWYGYSGKYVFPYIPTYLVFREGPLLYELLKDIAGDLDLIIFDGQGIIHPLRVGIATHMGFIFDKKTIGFAKKLLYGNVVDGKVIDPEDGMVLGYEVKLGKRGGPVYISPGYRISPERAVEIIKSMADGYKIPKVIRSAHIYANKLRKEGGL